MVLGRKNVQKLENDVFCLTEERNYFQSKYLEQISELTALHNELTNAKRDIQKLRTEVMSNSVASMSIKDDTKEEDASKLTTRLTLEEPNERQQVSISSRSSGCNSDTALLDNDNENDNINQEVQGEEKKEEEMDQKLPTTRTRTTTNNNDVQEEDELQTESVEYEETESGSESVVDLDDEDDSEEEEVDDKTKLRMDAERLLQWADYRSSVSRRESFTGGSSAASANSSQRQSFGVPRTIQSTSLKEEVDEEEMSMQD
jgi:hypothetical protein